MPVRKTVLADGEIYHVFNRCVGSERPFASSRILKRTIKLLSYYKYKNDISFSKFNTLSKADRKELLENRQEEDGLVEIYAYAIMPNHFHLLLKQISSDGIKKLVANFQNSLAKYINLSTDRNGSLFQNTFKARRVVTDEELMHISRYIHLNPVTAYLVNLKRLKTSPLTSYRDYVLGDSSLVDSSFILDLIGGIEKYREFLADQEDYQKELATIKNLIIEKH